MTLDVVFLPRFAVPGELAGKAVGVFDVLRATTTMAIALERGAGEIRIFDDLDSARAAAREEGGGLLVGETQAIRPADFDLGNSPVEMAEAESVEGRTLFMSTTNGTRAIVAAHDAALVVPAALVNAAAAAGVLAGSGLDVTLVCAGTNGAVALEDLVGAGAVLDEMLPLRDGWRLTDSATVALRLFESVRHDLRATLADSQGGRNVIAAGLEPDIDFAARLNVCDAVGRVEKSPLRVVRVL